MCPCIISDNFSESFILQKMSFVIRVSALVCNEDKILFVQEGKENVHYGKWNMPGGHLEEGEKLIEAVKREIKEETGLIVDVQGLIGIYNNFNRKHYIQYVFKCKPIKGEIKAQRGEILNIAWMKKNDVELMPDSAFVYPYILKKMLSDHDDKKLISLDYISEF